MQMITIFPKQMTNEFPLDCALPFSSAILTVMLLYHSTQLFLTSHLVQYDMEELWNQLS